jgi:regulator of replication initiation timing
MNEPLPPKTLEEALEVIARIKANRRKIVHEKQAIKAERDKLRARVAELERRPSVRREGLKAI